MGLVASARSSSDRNAPGSPFPPTRSQLLRSPFGPRSSGGIRTRRDSQTSAQARCHGLSRRGRAPGIPGRPGGRTLILREFVVLHPLDLRRVVAGMPHVIGERAPQRHVLVTFRMIE